MKLDNRKPKLILPAEIKAYKLNVVPQLNRTYKIQAGYDIFTLENVNVFRGKFYPIDLNKYEVKAINEHKYNIEKILQLYIILKSITHNGQFGVLIAQKYLKKKISYKFHSGLHHGINSGFFSAYKLVKILYGGAPRTIIYFNSWWEVI